MDYNLVESRRKRPVCPNTRLNQLQVLPGERIGSPKVQWWTNSFLNLPTGAKVNEEAIEEDTVEPLNSSAFF